MSGGYFNYSQHHITDIADSIEQVIIKNNSTEKDQWGSRKGRGYNEVTIEHLVNAVVALRTAVVYAQRADYLLSGDDGSDSFVRRLTKELEELKC